MNVFRRYLTRDEELRLFRCMAARGDIVSQRDYAWHRLARVTGLRVGALSRLTCGDARLALREGYLCLRPEIMKGGRAHSVFVVKKAARALRDLLRIRREMSAAESIEAPLIVSRGGRGISVRTLQSRCRHWQHQAGLSVPYSPHWLRHTFAQRLVRDSTARQPLAIAQIALGHERLSSTAIYTKPSREDVADALAEVA